MTNSGGIAHLVAVLDLWMIVSPVTPGAFWLRKGRPRGFALAAGLLVQGTLTMVVLTVSAPITSAAGIAGAWDLVPLWLLIGVGCFSLFAS